MRSRTISVSHPKPKAFAKHQLICLLYEAVGSLAMFNRTINHLSIADGTLPVTANLSTTGSPNATHTESYVPLPPTASASSAAADSPIEIHIPKEKRMADPKYQLKGVMASN